MNKAEMIVIVIANIFPCPSPRKPSKNGMLRKPSTAVVTVIAGVKIPSASKAAPPTIAGIISHFARLWPSV